MKLFMRLLVPQAQAAGAPYVSNLMMTHVAELPGEGTASSFSSLNCDASQCAFLVDTGRRDSASSKDEASSATILAATPVINGQFKFSLPLTSQTALAVNDNPLAQSGGESSSNPLYEGHIYKVVVRGWDNAAKAPMAYAASDREYTLSSHDLQAAGSMTTNLEITPESTLAAQHRAKVLKRDYMDQSLAQSFVQQLAAFFQVGSESIREMSVRIISMFTGSLVSVDPKTNLVTDAETGRELTERALTDEQVTLNPMVYNSQLIYEQLKVRYATINLGMLEYNPLIGELDNINLQATNVATIRANYYSQNNIQGLNTLSGTFHSDYKNYMFYLNKSTSHEAGQDNDDTRAAAAASAEQSRLAVVADAKVLAPLCYKSDQYMNLKDAVFRITALRNAANPNRQSDQVDSNGNTTPYYTSDQQTQIKNRKTAANGPAVELNSPYDINLDRECCHARAAQPWSLTVVCPTTGLDYP